MQRSHWNLSVRKVNIRFSLFDISLLSVCLFVCLVIYFFAFFHPPLLFAFIIFHFIPFNFILYHFIFISSYFKLRHKCHLCCFIFPLFLTFLLTFIFLNVGEREIETNAAIEKTRKDTETIFNSFQQREIELNGFIEGKNLQILQIEELVKVKNKI